MADSKLADLTATTSPADTDILYVVADPAGTPADRKVTVANLRGTGLADHLADTADAHDASAISVADVAGQYAATDVEGALAEVLDALQAHEADTADAHDASAISFAATGGIASTDVQAAIAELDSEKAASSHAHTSADISDFAEAVDDRVDALIVDGTGIDTTYDDGANTLTITVDKTELGLVAADLSDFNEAAQDAVGTILADSSSVNFTYTDATPEITATVTASGVDHGGLGGLSDDDHTGYARLAGRSGGQTLYGGTGSGDDLIVKSTSHATKGTIDLEEHGGVRVRPTNETFTAAPTWLTFAGDYTLDFANASTNPFVSFTGKLICDQAAYALGLGSLFSGSGTLKNKTSEANNLGPFYTFLSNLTIQADDATITQSVQYDFISQLTTSRLTSGGLTITNYAQFRAGGLTVGANTTVTTRRGLSVADATNNGTLTTNVGVDIDALSAGATNIGIRTAAPIVLTPVTKTISAGSDTIPITHPVVNINTVSAGGITLTSNPTIADTGATEGQLLTIVNTDSADSVTFTDGNNIQLAGGALVLGPRDVVTFIYLGSEWKELARSNN